MFRYTKQTTDKMEELSKWFWNEGFWLPDGYTWADMQPTPGVRKPIIADLYYTPLLAALLLLARLLFENLLAKPFCHFIGIRGVEVLEENPTCEKFFKVTSKRPTHQQVKELADSTNSTKARVQRWFRKRRKLADLSLMRKATESTWRGFSYTFLFLLGSYAILPTAWFYDCEQWTRGYTRTHDFTLPLKAYFLTELSFYVSLLFSQFIDAKRKDFYQMFVHHIVTISLILVCYATDYHRFGAVIMWLHDAADVWLEAAKVFNYAKWQRVCDNLFVMFALVFFATRWIFYPFWVLHAYIFITPAILGKCNGVHTFLAVKLCVLQVLHLYWGYLIARMAYELTTKGVVKGDTRSDSENATGSEDEDENGNSSEEQNKKDS